MMYVIFQLRVAGNTANISCFPRRLQRNTFRLPRRLQDVFAIRLPKTSSRRLQDVLEEKKNVTLKTSSRRLQDVFSTSSPRRMFAGKQLREATMCVLFQLIVAAKQLRTATVCILCQIRVASSEQLDVCLVPAQSSWEVVQSNCDQLTRSIFMTEKLGST